uniref:C2 domain-containing protein n=1 Tax=Aegilops tauschii TaxID=37682 RepID=M8CBZ4_AEGTA
MAYPYVFHAQAPPARAEEHKSKGAMPQPQVRPQWPVGSGAGRGCGGGGAGWMGLGSRERPLASAYDLVEQMHYLYVRVVKARGIPVGAVTGGCNPYVEVRLGNYRGTTPHHDRKSSPEWNQVFAFSRERVQATALEVFVRDRDAVARDDYVGRVAFDISEVPLRVPPDSPLAPQWYRLESVRHGGKMVLPTEVMLAVWVGTQADEAFGDAWHADAASARGGADGVAAVQSARSKVYVTPKLWYLRINVLEAQDVVTGGFVGDKVRQHVEVFAKVQVGGMMLRTKPCAMRNPTSLAWNEELGLTPMKTADGRGTTDAYCVAKYGQKWVRTRTVVDSCSPRWNEQYTWEVYDPCTVLTLAMFDNCHLGKANAAAGNAVLRDQVMGKVRIRLSTLEMDKVYTNAHHLVVLHPSGVRKNGELCLAVRLTSVSLASVMCLYGKPLLPKMHYVQPFAIPQLDALRRQAMSIVAARAGRARLRSVAGRIQTVVGDVATQGERVRSLLAWRDPRATALFTALCLVAAVTLYVSRMPSAAGNFFKRLPSRADTML